MAGEYRTEEVLAKLPPKLAEAIRNGLRIGLTNQPMSGVVVKRELSEEMAEAFERAGEMKYAKGLRNGEMVPLVAASGNDGNYRWRPGELFLST